MKIALLFAAFTFLFATVSTFGEDAAPTGKKLFHVVSLKYKEGTTPAQIKAVDEAFAALKTKVPGITSLHWGDNVSPEKHDHGYTQCFVLTFATATDRDAYLIHPEHKAFGAILGPVMSEVMVLDFWGNE